MAPSFHYADLKRRCLALVLDFLLFIVVFFPITRLVEGVWLMSAQDHRWVYGWFIMDPICIVFLLVIILYFVLLEGLAGATVGKWVLGLRVVGPDGSRPGLRRSALRTVLRVVDGLPALSILGAVLIASCPERGRVGDRVAGTKVIRVR